MKNKSDKKLLSRAATALRESFKGKHTIFHIDNTPEYVYVYSVEPLTNQLKSDIQLLAGPRITLLFRVSPPKNVI